MHNRGAYRMNKNEIRGYIFMAFAVMCLAVYTLGDISSRYIRPSDILIVFLIFAPVFGFIAAYCFANAYTETKGTNILNITVYKKDVSRIMFVKKLNFLEYANSSAKLVPHIGHLL